MKILVIDDTEIQREAAKAQLKDHDLTVLGTHKEAQELLRGFKGSSDNLSREEQLACRHDYEVVLTDLMLPPDLRNMARPFDFEGQLMPVGIFLAIFAAMKGAKFVGVLSDLKGHSHPVADMVMAIWGYTKQPFTIAEARVCIGGSESRAWKYDLSALIPYESPSSHGGIITLQRYDNGTTRTLTQEEYDAEQTRIKADSVTVKNWKGILDTLLAGK